VQGICQLNLIQQASPPSQIPKGRAGGKPAPPSAAATAAARAARKRKLKETPADAEPENCKAELRMVGGMCRVIQLVMLRMPGISFSARLAALQWCWLHSQANFSVTLQCVLLQVKNRESAARSRERKQAYTNDLEAQVNAKSCHCC
jgi:bZIP transcription factor